MASFTAPPPDGSSAITDQDRTTLAAVASAVPVVRIEPPRGWFDLRLAELWEVPRAFVFLCVAGHQGPLQANRNWRDLGDSPATNDHGRLHDLLRPPRKTSIQRIAISGFLFCGACAMGLFFAGFEYMHKHRSVEPGRDHEGVFPAAGAALAAVCSGLLDFAIGFVVMIILTLAFGIHPPATVVLLPAFLVLAVLTALGVGLWTSALNALYRDVASVIPFLVQFWMLASPVAYPSSLVPAKWRWLYGLNPMAGVIDGFRWALTGVGQPPGVQIVASTAAVIALLLGGLFFFQRVEGTVADRV
jgi:lipopolysaccharide transport system permease protein